MTTRGHYIQEWRLYRHLTQEQVADRIEATKATVSRIERGLVKYKQETLEAFALALGCEPADLLRPPPPSASPSVNELATYVLALDKAKQQRAIQILKAAFDHEKEAVA